MSKTYRQLHDMTDKNMSLNFGNRSKKLKNVDGYKWHEIFAYLEWKYNTTRKEKEAEAKINFSKVRSIYEQT